MVEDMDPQDQAIKDVLEILKSRDQTLATAESLTAGLVAASIANVPGASAVLRGGLVVYATDLKGELANVPAELLEAKGPVDPATAEALAAGARARCKADWGLATTGVAGPDPQDSKPVGMVYIAVAGPESTTVRELSLTGDRAAIRAQTVTAVIELLAEQLRA